MTSRLVRGDNAEVIVTITREDDAGVDQPVDLTLSGTKLWFTLKLQKADAVALAVKGYNTGDGLSGITPNMPVTAGKNKATIELAPADTDVSARWVHYDVQLEEPDGRKTTPVVGMFRVVADVTR